MIVALTLCFIVLLVIKLIVGAVKRWMLAKKYCHLVPSLPMSFPLGHIAGFVQQVNRRHLYFQEVHSKVNAETFLMTSGIIDDNRGNFKLVTRDLEMTKQVLKDRETFSDRPFGGTDIFARLGLLALRTSDPMWSAHRKLLSPLFAEKFMRSYCGVFAKHSEDLCGIWREELTSKRSSFLTIDVSEALVLLTLDVIGEAGFGTDFGALQDYGQKQSKNNAYVHASNTMLQEGMLILSSPMSIVANFFRRRLVKNARSVFQRAVIECMHSYRESHENQADNRPSKRMGKIARGDSILDALIQAQARKEIGSEEVQDESDTLLTAGHETTSNTLTWALYLLAKNPLVQEKAASVCKEFSQRSVTLDDIKRLTFVRWIVEESLRLFPTVVLVPRQSVKPFTATIEGKQVDFPAKTTVFVNLLGLNRSSKLWGETADQFDPERFNPENLSEEVIENRRACFIPFGHGARKCIGYRFALNESVLILATLLSKFRFEPSSEEPVEFVDVTLKPKNGLHLKVYPR